MTRVELSCEWFMNMTLDPGTVHVAVVVVIFVAAEVRFVDGPTRKTF